MDPPVAELPETGNAYTGLADPELDVLTEDHWAFGTGFSAPLDVTDGPVPDGVDADALAAFTLAFGDDALVLSQRLAQWCTHAPELEEEVALANIALDLLGQATLLLARAGSVAPRSVPVLPEGSPVPVEDRLAFFRGPGEFRNVALVEAPNGDFAQTVVRLAIFSAWRLAGLDALTRSADPVLAAIAQKAALEVRYHRDYAARWFITLAQGTEYSRTRMEVGLNELWPYVAELETARSSPAGLIQAQVVPEPTRIWEVTSAWLAVLLERADLAAPAVVPVDREWSRVEALVPLVEELQGVARAHPLGRW